MPFSRQEKQDITEPAASGSRRGMLALKSIC
jgi:hypothetical protein